MKKLIISLILIFCFISNSNAQEWYKDNFLYSFENTDKWDAFDKILMTSYTSSTIIDCLQTQYIFDHPESFYEKNTVISYGVDKIGKSAIPIYFVALNLTNYYIADHLKDFEFDLINWRIKVPTRKIFLLGINALSYDTVHNNFKIGIKAQF